MFKEIKEKTDLSLDKFSELLKNPPQSVYVSIYTKKRIEVEPVGHSKDKVTLSKLAEEMRAGFKQVNDRIDTLTHDVKNIKTRLDKVEMRLDYIVETNNLKDSK